jgi:hypothetical protein
MPQDALSTVSSLLSGLSVLTFVFLARRNRGRKRVLITDYRRGVRFVGGVFSKVLEAGSHTFDTRKEQIEIVDMRPQPILIERLAFQDALGHSGLISLAADLLIRDPQLVATTLRDQIKDSYILTRDTVRNAVSQQIVSGKESLPSVTASIATAAQTELSKVGMDISDLEVTELWTSSPSVPQHTMTGTTVVQ